MVKNGNFILEMTSSGQESQFHIATDMQWSQIKVIYSYWHLVVNNGNFSWLPTWCDQEWQFYIGNEIELSRMSISHCYWYLVIKKASLHTQCHVMVKNGNFSLAMTSSDQELQFDIATDI